MKDKTKNKLDKIYKSYTEETGFEKKLLKYKFEEISKHFKGSSALDIGCGVGLITKMTAKHFENVVGIDGSKEKIAVAKKLYNPRNVKYFYSLFEEFNPDRLFDCAIMTNVLEHIKRPTLFLKRVRRWLKPAASVIITVPNALSFHKRLGKEMGLISNFYKLTKEDKLKGHYIVYDKKKLANHLQKAGYSPVKCSGFFFKPFSSKQMGIYSDKVLDGLYQIGKKYPDICSSLIAVGKI